MVEVPAVVRNKAVAVGADGWLASISDVVADLVSEWDLTLVSACEEGDRGGFARRRLRRRDAGRAQAAHAAPGRCRPPGDTVLRLVDGDGCVRLLARDDVHRWNALRSDGGWALVDPDGLLAEPEYDLGILMREDPVELLLGDPWDRVHFLGERCGCDTTAVWEWGVVERVSTGLLATSIGLEVEGRDMLRAADVVASRDG